jgi:CP family cyanate transporter-like MFS transporter
MPAALHADRLKLAAVIVLIALNLRPTLASLAPVLNEIMASTGLSAAGASVLTTVPVLCLGLSGALAPPLARRIGTERAVLFLLALIAAGAAVRGAASVGALVIGSVVAGTGIGLGNVLVPVLLKRDFHDHAPLMTGIYTTALCIGASVASGATAPLYRAFGHSWPAALVVWALPVLAAIALATVVWAVPLRTAPTGAAGSVHLARGLWRDALAWQVTLYMGLQAALAYCVFGWLAPVLRSRGDSAVTAGLVASVVLLAQVPACLPAPLFAARLRRQSVPAAIPLLVIGACFVLLLWGPLEWQWLVALVMGLAMGAAFALAVMFMVLRAPDGHRAAQLSSMAQSVGYTMAAAGPLLMGVLHDLTGDWTGAGVMFPVVGVIAAAAGALAGRDRFVGRLSA